MKARYLIPSLVLAMSCGQVDTAGDPSSSEQMDPQEAEPVEQGARMPSARDERETEAAAQAARREPAEQLAEGLEDQGELVGTLSFREVDPGIELFDDEIMIGVRSARLTVVRISTPDARLSLAASEGPKDPGYSLMGYQKTRGARVVLSGGFLASFYPPLAAGFVKSDGVVRNRHADDPFLNGILEIAGGRVAITAFHGVEGTEAWQHVLQSGPLLVIDGRSVLPDSGAISDRTLRNVIEQVYARAFVAVDTRGRTLLGWLNGATLPDLVALLTRPAAAGGLECRTALNLSGHRNAGLLVAAGRAHLEVGDTKSRLPNAIVVY